MRMATVFLRRGKLFAKGGKDEPIVTDATVDGMHQALSHVLVENRPLSEVPKSPSPWPTVTGGETEDAFFDSVEKMGMVRERDDCTELLLGRRIFEEEDGTRVGTGWHSKVVQELPAGADLREVAAAMLELLEHRTFPSRRVPPE